MIASLIYLAIIIALLWLHCYAYNKAHQNRRVYRRKTPDRIRRRFVGIHAAHGVISR